MIESHDKFMLRAIQLSKRGFPAPNPHVGCVLVRNGVIVGEGFHNASGQKHAEIAAIESAKEDCAGATAYVTLEPCNHHGLTPPCSEALIRHKVSRVVYAVPDPNPKATGGAIRLQEAGISVTSGIMQSRAEKENWIFLNAMRQQRPSVVVKAAMTADGFMAKEDGSSKWITGARAREEGHRLRANLGCVLVGWRTVLADDPALTARIRGVVNQPKRIVIDPHGKLTGSESVFDAKGSFLWVVREGNQTHEKQFAIPNHGLVIERVLSELWRQGQTGLLVEGGPKTIRGFFDIGLVDMAYLFIAPKLFGEGMHFSGSQEQGNDMRFESTRTFDSDICLVLKSQKLEFL